MSIRSFTSKLASHGSNSGDPCDRLEATVKSYPLPCLVDSFCRVSCSNTDCLPATVATYDSVAKLVQ